jgi:nucleoside-diphosphate-sugar epimerase
VRVVVTGASGFAGRHLTALCADQHVTGLSKASADLLAGCPHEVMELRGSYDALRAATGWEPQIPLAQTLQDALTWWRDEPARARTAAPPPARDRPPRS